MSVKVIARIRPLLKNELEKDRIVEASSDTQDDGAEKGSTIVRIPNPKNFAESFSFSFNSVYDSCTTQQQLFDNEISPTVKHLFAGRDVTIFAYGVTGTGKTHTMRGGKSLADRGVIPRLLSSVYRKGRKIEKESEGATRVTVALSYYEIYNDKVFDLFEPAEKRTLAGLPIREHGGRTIVAGLSERPCTTLREFEQLYDEANVNRSTSATKLNAHSSRSHAILCVKVSQTSDEMTTISTASAIDLAGSEDNRRTDNDRERLVESSAINRSLFVLAQCVEAISKKQARIPYRESKMTRILSLGQNRGLTVMILNLAPVKSYHLDTLSSLTVASRTKKIEIREIENEPVFKGYGKTALIPKGSSVYRQPLQSLCLNTTTGLNTLMSQKDKPAKEFSVYEEAKTASRSVIPSTHAMKRHSEAFTDQTSRPTKIQRFSGTAKSLRPEEIEISRADLEALVNRMVEEKLALRIQEQEEEEKKQKETMPRPAVNRELQERLEALEQRIERHNDGRAEGLQYLLEAKQYQIRGDDESAMRMYQLAVPFFPNNAKLSQKMSALKEKIAEGTTINFDFTHSPGRVLRPARTRLPRRGTSGDFLSMDTGLKDRDNHKGSASLQSLLPKARKSQGKTIKFDVFEDHATTLVGSNFSNGTTESKQPERVGCKRADNLVSSLCTLDEDETGILITDLEQLGALKGVGAGGLMIA